jgi:hypothetical protein
VSFDDPLSIGGFAGALSPYALYFAPFGSYYSGFSPGFSPWFPNYWRWSGYAPVVPIGGVSPSPGVAGRAVNRSGYTQVRERPSTTAVSRGDSGGAVDHSGGSSASASGGASPSGYSAAGGAGGGGAGGGGGLTAVPR